MLSLAVENFTQTHPHAHFEMFDLASKEMLEGLESGDLDVAVSAGQPHETRGLHWVPLTRARWQLAVPRHHPLARRTRIAPADIAGEPLLVYCQRDYPEYWDSVVGWLHRQQQRPRIARECDGVDSLLAAVESGLGVALVAAGTAERLPRRVRLRSLPPAPAPLCSAAGCRRRNFRPAPWLNEPLRSKAGPKPAALVTSVRTTG